MSAVRGRNVIGQAVVELSPRLLNLLTQEIKRGDVFRSRVMSVKIDIIAHRVCWPKSMDASSDQQVVRDDPIKKCLRIFEKFARLFPNFGVVENRWITATQFPRVKKRRPIDEGN